MSAWKSSPAATTLTFVPGAAAVTPALRERLARADIILFDGTLFTDDEMIASGTGEKTGRRMGHMPIDGADGSLAALEGAWQAAHLHPHQQHQSDPDRGLAGTPAGRGRRLRGGGGRTGDQTMKLMTPDELEAELREIGAKRYHRLHPFHGLLHGGKCTKGQVQAWALNRYYYQACIPLKDAALIARCDDSAIRREWRSRLHDHDGEGENDGGIARWLKLTDGLGLDREYVTSLRGLLPGTKFAVEAYVHFVREKTLLEAIASSLTELFSPVIIGERVEGMLKGYSFVTPETLAYFAKRPPQAKKDSDFALDYVKRNARTPAEQRAVLGGARIQVRRAVVDARRAALCLRGAGVHSARRLRAAGVSDDRRRREAEAAARRAAHPQRGAGRLGAARAGARVQGRRAGA